MYVNSWTRIDTHTLTTEQCVKVLNVREFINNYWCTYTVHRSLCRGFKGHQCMCINTCWWNHVHLKPWHSTWWSVYVYQYLLMNSRTFKTLTQCLMISICVSMLVDHCVKVLNVREFINKYWYICNDHRPLCQWVKRTWIHQQVSVWWSVYVNQSLFINSRTFKSLSQCSVVNICVSILVDEFMQI
jgi:hypothetical protein